MRKKNTLRNIMLAMVRRSDQEEREEEEKGEGR
jgi:hypothetical protein